MINKNIENDIKVLLNLFKTGNFNLVITKCKKLIKEFPEYLILYNILGSGYQNIGKFNLAKEVFLKGYKMDSNNIAIMNNLANTYKSIGEIDLSENLFNKIIKKNSNYINAYVNLGNLKRDFNNFSESIKLYEKALKINDKVPVTLYSLALAHQGIGNFTKANDYAQRVLKLDPKFTQADMLISQSTKYDLDNDHYNLMIKKIEDLDLNSDQKINLHFAIAKANEDFGNTNKSFVHFDLGNKIKRKTINFDIKDEIILFNSIKQNFNKFNFKKIQQKKVSNKKLIFILGMPRSGTSLVEQIVSSHSMVFGAGELPQLSKIVQNHFLDNGVISMEKLNELINDDKLVEKLNNNFYKYISSFNSKEFFITDKAPLNFRWIGFIKVLFPDSKIIHCVRNPKDNCFSLYKNLFEGGLGFTYDQKELGAYYNLYSDLMNFWKKHFTNSIYEIKYEEIIENSDVEIKKLISFCNLSWESDCLTFYKNKSPIKTMSTAQARKPIYKTSINSYEKFSSFLGDLNKLI